jgi:hypothetical protein
MSACTAFGIVFSRFAGSSVTVLVAMPSQIKTSFFASKTSHTRVPSWKSYSSMVVVE